jgi:hypothetical protein
MLVSFFLYEKQSVYGPINPQPQELTSENVTKLLEATINAGKFIIPTIMCNSQV